MSARVDRDAGSLAAALGLEGRAAALLDAFVAGVSDIVALLDPALVVRFVSSRIRETRGYEPAALVGRSALDFVPAANAAVMRAARDALLGTVGAPGTLEPVEHAYRPAMRLPDGSVASGRATAWAVRDREGAFAGLLVALDDTTARVRLEEAQRESERRLSAVFDGALQLSGLLSPEGTLLRANRAALEAIAAAEADVVGRPFWETPWWSHDPAVQAAVRAAVGRAAAGETVRFETTHQTADGHPAAIDFSLTPTRDEDGRIEFLVPEGRDLAPRRRAEEALRDSEARFRSVFLAAGRGIVVSDPRGRLVQVNPAFAEMLGYAPDELAGRPVSGLTHLEDWPEERRAVAAALARDGTARLAKRFVHRDGRTVQAEVILTGVRDDAGALRYLLGIVEDVTERYAMQASLRASEQRYRRLFESAHDAIFLMDGERFVDCNARTLELFGCARDEIVGARPGDFSPACQPDGRDSHVAARERLEAAFRGEPSRFPWQHRRRDGSPLDVEVSLSPVALDTTSYVLAIVRDVTRQKELERHLAQTQRLEALGTLAGGIAHDFNNILAAVQGYSELGLLRVPEGGPGHAELVEVHRAARRAAELVQQILAFSRSRDDEQRPIDAHAIVTEALRLLRASLPATIEVRADLAPRAGVVLASPSRLHQIILNLCTNAFHAMETTGGRLRVVLDAATLDAAEAAARPPLAPGPHVRLVVQDTGVGMDEQTLRRCFEPFYTTKEVGRGTGLGLSVVHGAVTAMGGHVSAESAPGQGATFTVLLPAAPTAAAGEGQVPVPPPRGAGRVLVVDDEPAVLALETRMLSWLGYEVVGCTRSLDALAAFEAEPDRFVAVVSDHTMPELTGASLLARLRALRPALPVVLCTGYSEPVDAETLAHLGVRAVLPKPFTQLSLGQAVRDAVAGPRPA